MGGPRCRSIRLPVIGVVPVRGDTRRLRRLLRPDASGESQARIAYATVAERRGRFVVTLTAEVSDFHPARRHPPAGPHAAPDFVGVDLGLSAWVVLARAQGGELDRKACPKALGRSFSQLRQLSKDVSRKEPGSRNRRKAAARLRRFHARVADQRRDATHRLSTAVVNTHDQLCIENLAVANLVRNRSLSRHLADACLGELARQLAYKAAWYGCELAVAPRLYPSSKRCSACGVVRDAIQLSERAFHCPDCGFEEDRDLNAARNLAAWANAEYSACQAPDPEARGRVTTARGGRSAGRHPGDGGTPPEDSRNERGRKREPTSGSLEAS